MQSAIQTGNSKESSGICFLREDKAVAGLGPAAYWRYVRSPRRDTNAVFHRSCTFGTVGPPENIFRNPRVAAEIDSIVWTAYGKVLRVVRSSVSSKPDLHFAYGPDGNRLSKKAVYGNDSTVWTFYVRDAQGNTMATYRHKESSGVLHLTDHVLYGSSRLGSHERKQVELLGAGSSPITARAGIFGLERGDKRYELSNHLGNVLTVVSDRRAKASCADTVVVGENWTTKSKCLN